MNDECTCENCMNVTITLNDGSEMEFRNVRKIEHDTWGAITTNDLGVKIVEAPESKNDQKT